MEVLISLEKRFYIKKLKRMTMFVGILMTMNLFSYTEDIKPSSIEVELIPNKETKVLINCTYKKTKFYENQNINDFLEFICKDNKQGTQLEIKLSELNQEVKKFNSETIYAQANDDARITYKEKPLDYESIETLVGKELYFSLVLSRLSKRLLSNENADFLIKLPIISMENARINVEYELFSQFAGKTIFLEEKYIIKNYKYNVLNKNIEHFEIDRAFEKGGNVTITNNYSIDEISECINGKVWVKKYGAETNDKCEYIRKK